MALLGSYSCSAGFVGWSVGVTTRLSQDITVIERDLDRAFEELATISRRVSEIETARESALDREVTVYYAKSTMTESHLVPVRQRVDNGVELMKGALALVRGPLPESGLERTIPKEQVKRLAISGDLATVDFSKKCNQLRRRQLE